MERINNLAMYDILMRTCEQMKDLRDNPPSKKLANPDFNLKEYQDSYDEAFRLIESLANEYKPKSE